MKRLAVLLGLLPAFLAGCLEPGPTPLGPQVSDLDPPDSLIILQHEAVLASARSWEEPQELTSPDMLFCGRDPDVSGFRAEPLWSFDLEDFLDYGDYLNEAGLIIHLPPASYEPDSTESLVWDNPDIERDLRFQLVRLPRWPDDEEALESLADLGEPQLLGEPLHPAEYEDQLYGIPIPLDSMRAWIEDYQEDEPLCLGLRVDAGSENGLLRIYARGASAPQDTLVPDASLKISYFIDEQKDATIECDANAQAISREDPLAPFEDGLSLATGLPRHSWLELNLPEELADSTLLIFRARLYLDAPADSLVGLGPLDKDLGGLTFRILAPKEEWDPLSDELPEEYFILSSGFSLFDEDGDLTDPLPLPLTGWLQDWARGEVENRGLILDLNGSAERPRALNWPALGELGARLEVYYTGRPDFE